jgi:MOSC domain-containing protein YiiM
MSELVSIVYKPRDADRDPNGYTRVPRTEARLIEGYGIEGDAKGGGTWRHLNIMSAETVQSLTADCFRTAPGQLGEQLVVKDLAVDRLPAGTRLRIGTEALVEVVEPRTGCAVFERHQEKSPQLAAGRLGVIAKVLVGGPIRIGDPITVREA